MTPRPGAARRAAADRAVIAHRRAFNAAPASIGIAPGRANLIGEHTDYNGGFVLPIAIDRVCAVGAGPAANPNTARIYAADLDQTAVLDGRRTNDARALRDTLPPWALYPAGVWMCLRERAVARGVRPVPLDIAITSDVPLGAGLASSAALEAATAMAIDGVWSLDLPPDEFARECQAAEHDYAGVPCGIMDQFAAFFSNAGHALLLDCRCNSMTHIPLPSPDAPDGAVILIANTGIRHTLGDGEYAARRRACESAARALGFRTLRDADEAMLARSTLTDEQRRCARHVITENARTLEFAAILTAAAAGQTPWPDALRRAGELMLASHRSLRDDFRVSCAELDALVDIATTLDGVYGARMTGAGFGGCTITIAAPAAAQRISEQLQSRYHDRFHRPCDVFAVTPSSGAESHPFPSVHQNPDRQGGA